MPAITQLTAVWKNIKEFELEPVRKEALRPLRIAVLGKSGTQRLAELMRGDIYRSTSDRSTSERSTSDRSTSERSSSAPGDISASAITTADLQGAVLALGLEQAAQADAADLIILVVDPADADLSVEQALCRLWGNAGKRVLLVCNSADTAQAKEAIRLWAPWNASGFVCLLVEPAKNIEPDQPANDIIITDHSAILDANRPLLDEFVPAVLNLLPPELHLALGRQLPLFRVSIAHKLISDTCYNNAAYALGSGLAEVVPALNLPLNVADMIVLTKAQAFLAYRMGLLVGFSTAWQDYLAEFGSVVGSGFLWRQLARSLVGLIPVWGIVPKVAVAYAGTYVVGNSILQWYLTGRHLNPRQIRALYRQALTQGKRNAQKLTQNLPKVRLPARLGRRKSQAELPPAQEIPLPLTEEKICPACHQPNSEQALFCMHCGANLASGG